MASTRLSELLQLGHSPTHTRVRLETRSKAKDAIAVLATDSAFLFATGNSV